MSENTAELVDDDVNGSVAVIADMPSIKLFSPLQIGLGAFFGTPLAGFLLVAANLRSVGKQPVANVVAVVAVLIMPLIILLYANIPQQPYEKLFPAISAVFTLLIGRALMPKNLGRDSERRSFWSWLAYLLGGLGAVFILLLCMIDLIR